jgi:hypothetical protein
MGAWGAGIFDNDDACDFAAEVVDGGGVERIASALDRVIDSGDGYLEAPEASEGLAAAELVARMNGRPGKRDAYTEKIDAWVFGAKVRPTDELMNKARRVVIRVRAKPSELLELWSEGGDPSEFLAELDGLAERLG